MIRRREDGLHEARCDGALDCNATSKPSPRNWAASTAKRAGWHITPGLDCKGEVINMGVTICPRCLEQLTPSAVMLGTAPDTGSDDRRPRATSKSLAPQDIMPDLIRKIQQTMRERTNQ